MVRPLYRDSGMPETRPASGDAGLWYDKYCNQWDDQWHLAPERKRAWLAQVTGNKVGDPALLASCVERLADLVTLSQGRLMFLRTRERFVTGLGRAHPLENGFAWHPLLGVPYLPGSSLKGLVRTWAGCWAGADTSRLFGPRGTDDKAVGGIVFFDALPTAPVRLEAEVMTPHYPGYYQGNQPPGDWYSPVPVPFLTVAAGQTFVFAVAPRRPGPDAAEETDTAAGWLTEALANLGAGAKTAAGYGLFLPDEKALNNWRSHREEDRRRREESKKEHELREVLLGYSPIRREMEQDGYSLAQTDGFMNALTGKWLARMEASPPEEGREIAGLLAAWYQEREPEKWRKPNKKNQEKIARIRKVLGH